jgi:hypothetical protein
MDPRAYVPHFHDLKLLAKSPQHYRAAISRSPEEREADSDKPVFRKGTITHKLTLGGDYVVFKGARRAGKDWDAFLAENAGRFIVKQDELDEAKRISEAALSHPLAADVLRGQCEVPVEWIMNGRKVATHGLDVLNKPQRFLTDLKTTNCAEPGAFQRAALRYGYHAQCAMYVDAAHSLGVNVEDVFVVAVETAAPYAVTVHRLSPRLLDEGRKLVRLWMEKLRACEEADEWPGYTQSICDWDIVEDSFGLIIDGEEVAA